MVIESITLVDYRNIEKLNITLSPSVNVFYGDNGQGKTNILESMYMCATGRSQRTHLSKELIRFGKDAAYIQLTVKKDTFRDKINIHIKNNNKKGIAINDISVRNVNELFGTVNIVFFSPEDLNLVKDGPSQRRKYMDMELCQLSRIYADNLSRYYKALRERNILLKNSADMLALDAYDEQLIEYGCKIIEKRAEFIEGLKERSAFIHKEITSSKEILDIKYIANISVDKYGESLKKARSKDIYYGTTNVGIHKDDISFYINNVNARDYGSQGQQRTVCLSVKLAEIELVEKITGYKPILLLDDVLSELDRSRQLYILGSIKDVQTIITSTGIDDIKNNVNNIKIFNVKDGKIV